jgi:membrane fusion protein (multidrug efflux system)
MYGSQPEFRPKAGLILPLLLTAACTADEDGAAQAAAPSVPAVVVEELRAETVPIFRQFVARTEAEEKVEIEARVEAVLETKEFEEGRRVEKDQVLYRLDRRTYEANLAAAEASLAKAKADLKLAEEQASVRAAEAAVAQAEATLKKTQKDVARLRPLAEKDAVPRQDLDTALAAEEVAQAQVDAQAALLENAKITEEVGILMAKASVEGAEASRDLARLNLEYCTIASPIDGLIGRTQVDVGNLVGRGKATVLATVSSVDPMYATFAISEAEYLRIMSRARERGKNMPDWPIDLILADDSIFAHKGITVTAERAVAVETGTLQIVTEFPNPDGDLRPGQFGRVKLQVDTVEDAVLVPQRAVMEQQSAKIVFVVGENNIVGVRTIQISERHEDAFIVVKGLKAGERVIVEGQLKARPGKPVKPMKSGVSSEPAQAEK